MRSSVKRDESGKEKQDVIAVLLLSLTIVVIYILVYLLGLESSVQGIMITIIVLTLLIEGYKQCQRYDGQRLTACILFLGCVMRIGYMLYTPCNVRVHDLRELTPASDGHAAYILNILQGHLPAGNMGQFYHPPLYPVLSALLIAVLKPLLGLSSNLDMINCARIVSCVFSCAALYGVRALCDELKLKKLLPVSLAAFLPGFYLMGGRVGNDAMALFFMTMILLFGIRWQKEQSIKNTVMLALAFGLGMLSKMSAALLAVPTAVMMLCVLIQKCKEHALGQTLKRLGIFAIISVPMGMAYPIRNLVLFSQPFNYILDVGGAEFESQKYSLIKRFLTFPIARMFHPVYNNVSKDYNIWMYLLKGGVFGEFQFTVAQILPILLLFTYAMVNLLLLVSVLWALKSSRKNKDILYMLLCEAVLMISYLWFNIRYPYGCTMDFRYIGIVFVINALLSGSFLAEHRETKYGRVSGWMTGGTVLCFSVVSVWMYCVI